MHQLELLLNPDLQDSNNGTLYCVSTWEMLWHALFDKMLVQAWSRDRITNSPSKDIGIAVAAVIQHVPPRLLDALDRSGNNIESCFMHGDLWEDNGAIKRLSGDVFMFDSSDSAHYEVEIAQSGGQSIIIYM